MLSFVHDPLSQVVAKKKDFSRVRQEVESLPVQCDDGNSFDCDERSEKRMVEAIDYWNDINQPTIDWRLSDNTTVSINRGQLQQYLAEIRKKRAVRGFVVYNQWRALKNNPSTTLRDLENWKDSFKV